MKRGSQKSVRALKPLIKIGILNDATVEHAEPIETHPSPLKIRKRQDLGESSDKLGTQKPQQHISSDELSRIQAAAYKRSSSDGIVSGGVIGNEKGSGAKECGGLSNVTLTGELRASDSDSVVSDCHISELSKISRDNEGKPIEIELCKL